MMYFWTSIFLAYAVFIFVLDSFIFSQVALRMAWCGLVLKQVENSIVNKNKHFEDLRNKNKALQA